MAQFPGLYYTGTIMYAPLRGLNGEITPVSRMHIFRGTGSQCIDARMPCFDQLQIRLEVGYFPASDATRLQAQERGSSKRP